MGGFTTSIDPGQPMDFSGGVTYQEGDFTPYGNANDNKTSKRWGSVLGGLAIGAGVTVAVATLTAVTGGAAAVIGIIAGVIFGAGFMPSVLEGVTIGADKLRDLCGRVSKGLSKGLKSIGKKIGGFFRLLIKKEVVTTKVKAHRQTEVTYKQDLSQAALKGLNTEYAEKKNDKRAAEEAGKAGYRELSYMMRGMMDDYEESFRKF